MTALIQVGLAGIIYGSLRDMEWVSFYLGFMKGKLSKAFFFLFCAFIIFPIGYNGQGSKNSWQWVFSLVACVMVVIASL